MRTVCVPVIRDFDYHGRPVAAGESVDVPAAEALALSRRGLVSLTAPGRVQTRALTAEPDSTPAPEAPKKRRRYRRRDLQAED